MPDTSGAAGYFGFAAMTRLEAPALIDYHTWYTIKDIGRL
jgi:hypothetical protein